MDSDGISPAASQQVMAIFSGPKGLYGQRSVVRISKGDRLWSVENGCSGPWLQCERCLS